MCVNLWFQDISLCRQWQCGMHWTWSHKVCLLWNCWQLTDCVALYWNSAWTATVLQTSRHSLIWQIYVYTEPSNKISECAAECLKVVTALHLLCSNSKPSCMVQQQQRPFNDPLSETAQLSWYQEGKTNLDFTEARESECQWQQLDHMQSAPRHSRQITTPSPYHSVFYRLDALPAAEPTASKHWRVMSKYCFKN